MQKPLSPVNLLSAAPAPAVRSKQGAPDNDGAQFTQALKREVAQRQEAGPAPAPARPVKQASPADAPKQAAVRAEKAAAAKQAAAPAEQARKAHVKEKQEDADAAAASAAAADATAVTPMVDMLALVASFQMRGQQPQQAAAPVADTLAGAGMSGLESQPGTQQSVVAALPGDADPGVPGGTPDGKFLSMMTRTAGAEDGAGDMMQKQDLFSKTPLVDTAPEPVITVARPGAEIAQPVRRDDTVRMIPADTAVSAPLTNAVQQASLTVAQAVNAAAGDKIPARVGTPGWDNQVAQKIVYMVGGGDMSASLTLNPPDLGPMQVVLNVTNDHADVTFTSAQPEVRQALEDAMPKLREMMSESGIALGNASVHDGAQQQAREQAASARGARARGPNGAGGEGEADAAANGRVERRIEPQGLVNTFA